MGVSCGRDGTVPEGGDTTLDMDALGLEGLRFIPVPDWNDSAGFR